MNRTFQHLARSLTPWMASAWALGAACGWAPSVQAAADPHAGHQMANLHKRSEHNYKMPAVKLVRDDGTATTLAQVLSDTRPAMVNFIYTSCNAICPVSSQVFAEFRSLLSPAERGQINMISFSIDPEFDTPARLTAYAKRFNGAGTWAHYTSSASDSLAVQRAFEAWFGDKMNHQPVTFLRAAPGKPWVRLDGFYGPGELMTEYQKTMQSQASDCATQTKSEVSSTAGPRAGINLKCKS